MYTQYAHMISKPIKNLVPFLPLTPTPSASIRHRPSPSRPTGSQAHHVNTKQKRNMKSLIILALKAVLARILKRL